MVVASIPSHVSRRKCVDPNDKQSIFFLDLGCDIVHPVVITTYIDLRFGSYESASMPACIRMGPKRRQVVV